MLRSSQPQEEVVPHKVPRRLHTGLRTKRAAARCAMPPAGRIAMGTGALDGRVDDDPGRARTAPGVGTATNNGGASLRRRCKQEPRESTGVPQQHSHRQATGPTPQESASKKSARGRGSAGAARGTWSTRICNEPGCSTVPSYGAPGTKRQFCRQHAREGMINVASKKCDLGSCGKVATYGIPGGKRERCAAHAGEKMVDIFNRKCVIEGCHLRATFGVEGGKRERCAKHTDDWMVNFNRRRCAVQGCVEVASHGVRRGRKQVFCSDHAKQDMVRISNKRCSHPGCMLAALYALAGGAGPRDVCARHSKGAADTQTPGPSFDASDAREAKPVTRGTNRKRRRNEEVVVNGSESNGDGVAKSSKPASTSPTENRRKRGRPAERSSGGQDRQKARAPPGPSKKAATANERYPRSDLMRTLASAGPGAGLRLLLQTESGWSKWDWQAALCSPQPA